MRKTVSHTKVAEIPTNSFIFVDLISSYRDRFGLPELFSFAEAALVFVRFQNRDLGEG